MSEKTPEQPSQPSQPLPSQRDERDSQEDGLYAGIKHEKGGRPSGETKTKKLLNPDEMAFHPQVFKGDNKVNDSRHLVGETVERGTIAIRRGGNAWKLFSEGLCNHNPKHFTSFLSSFIGPYHNQLMHVNRGVAEALSAFQSNLGGFGLEHGAGPQRRTGNSGDEMKSFASSVSSSIHSLQAAMTESRQR